MSGTDIVDAVDHVRGNPQRFAEAAQGALSPYALATQCPDGTKDTVVYYKRTITNLTPPDNKYIDMIGDEVDTEAQVADHPTRAI
eukprot:3224844-Rhodomonas_salina.5